MPQFLKKLLPGCPAEQLLDQNTSLSKELSAGMAGMIEDATTVFNRRTQNVTPITERRKSSAA